MDKKKKTVLIFVIAFVVIAIVGAIVLALTKEEEKAFVSSFVYNSDYEPKSYIFYEPDQNADIYADPDYQAVVSHLYYERDGIKTCITDGNYEKYGKPVIFFSKYFDALKAGNTEAFNSLHSQRYFENNRECTDIAPQRLYDITLTYLFERDMADEIYGEVTKYVFETKYMIMKNDGTFRSDIGSDASRKLYLEVIETQSGDFFVDACGDKYNLPQ